MSQEQDVWVRMNREFPLEQKVIVNMPCSNGNSLKFEGTILGKAIDAVVKLWIVSIDHPLNKYTDEATLGKYKATLIQANFIDERWTI